VIRESVRPSLPIGTGPFRPEQPDDFSFLRERLRAAGFTEKAVGEVLEGKSDRNIDVACAIRRTAQASPFHTLLRLFVLGMAVTVESAQAALSDEGVNCAIESGLLVDVADGIRARACLRPWRELFLLSDFLPTEGESLPADFVMSGISASSILLTRLTIRKQVEKALDLGTGAGIHALLAASHARHVVATDTNKRAINFASMNARLNGIENVSFAEGSFFEPVAGQKFDLIVSNPPFTISPPSPLLFQSAGLGGDKVSELILGESPAHLCEGGLAVALISWHHDREKDWASRPCAWVEGSGCDFWLLRATSADPIDYAANSLRQTERMGSPRYSELLDQWLEFYRERGFGRLALGAAIFRKRASPQNWIHCEDLSGAVVRSDAGEQIQRVFAGEDFLANLSNEEELLDARIAIHPDHLLEQKLVAGDDGWISQSLVLRPTDGIEHRAAIDTQVLMFLPRCNGTRTVRELISDVSQRDGVDFATTAAAGLQLIRRLLRAGFLVINEPELRSERDG
jgi:methylase of polypeptide subunit release factors